MNASLRNYLRVRGEYNAPQNGAQKITELPPRARRIPSTPTRSPWKTGTTSACAENTVCHAPKAARKRNYLRVRGEYVIMRPGLKLIVELPPRARRIPNVGDLRLGIVGTTSACAENTGFLLPSALTHRNYLRVRGEYKPVPLTRDNALELPPRARRILKTHRCCGPAGGTTSACAENTRANQRSGSGTWNYLRVRGEYPK